MLDLRFGVEIETVGLTQEELARAIARGIGGTVHTSYSATVVAMADGRAVASIVRDGASCVPWMLYTLGDDDLEALDRFEGVPG